MTFTIGQRWISNTEAQLGLGIITDLQGRQVGISFPAAEEERIYAVDNAPLSRIIYKEGEEIITNEQRKLRVSHVHEYQGIIIYSCVDEVENEIQITELALSSSIKLSTPGQRLFSGLLDKLPAFKLRIETLNQISRLQQSKVRGLLGSRTSHLPHQVYIASEVAQRYAPRVLLADEVGLGKTIEAGMILHYQLHTGRAKRVLIVVPDTLIHQWLVEMIRRFNLYFSIFDQKRYDFMEDAMEPQIDEEKIELLETTIENNLFETEQLIICSLDFLMANEKAREQAVASSWDIVIVDEAHHLHWSEESKSPEYSCIEQLAVQSKGLLLLTATPEQVGIESHFARLRLLDPSRFYDFATFKKEEQRYQEINKLVQKLIKYREDNQNSRLPQELATKEEVRGETERGTEVLTPVPEALSTLSTKQVPSLVEFAKESNELSNELKSELSHYLSEQTFTNIEDAIKNLLDRHGTGRVLFRNTRSAIQGFPERNLNFYPLPCPALYTPSIEQSGTIHLYPEITVEKTRWLEQDPRVEWLATLLNNLYPQKVLVICAKSETAIALEQHLKLKKGIHSTAFHEGLSIIDRDRAAAYFSEEENGAQTLICSEIGSEGRNFQFSHHLVLFDLPLNPDLLEQRIGRLDRIGQRHTIEIHTPYLLNTAQELLFRWYHEGINLFEKSCSVGFSIYETFAERLLPILECPLAETGKDKLQALITDTRDHTEQINKILQAGRDKLLELNSCDPVKARELIADIEAEENYLDLENYMAKVFQEYAIDHEYHSEYSEILRPTEHMKTSHFPGLKEDGITVTYSRAKALIREDIEFLSWEHPMVNESIEMILSSELGNTTLTTISVKSIPVGTLFLESFYTINCASPKHLQLDRFLPSTPIRILMDVSGKNLSKILSYTQLNEMCESVKRHLGYPIVKQVRGDLEQILEKSNQIAEIQMQEVLDQAHSEMKDSIGKEVSRLESLQKINPNIRDEEIDYFKKQTMDSEHFIKNATLKLQAIRVVINK